jgi:hypothetical protein
MESQEGLFWVPVEQGNCTYEVWKIVDKIQ